MCWKSSILAALASAGFTLGTVAASEFTVATRQVDDRKAVIATVEPLHLLAARARIGGTVIRLAVREGDQVEAGAAVALVVDQKIALQMTALDARILSAKSQLDLAKIELARTVELQKSGATSQSVFDQRRIAVDVADRTLAAMKADRDVIAQQATEGAVLAPTWGRVLKVAATEGSVILPGEIIATLAEDKYILRLQLPERHAAILRGGDSVEIVGRDGAATQQGKIRIVYPEIQGGRVIADVDVPGLGTYFVGERIRVYVPTGKRNVIVVPTDAVVTRAGVHYVRLHDGSDVVVQPGEPRADGVEILSGLAEGDVVVTP